MKSFTLNRVEAGLVQFAFYLGYFCLAIPAALIMRRKGYKTGLVIGLLLYATGAALFWPAAIVGRYWIFSGGAVCDCVGAVVSGDGLKLVRHADGLAGDRGATAEFFAGIQHSWLDCRGAGGDGFHFFRRGAERCADCRAKAAGTYATYLQHETMRVVAPYLVLGCIALTLAIVFMRTRFPEVAAGSKSPAERRRTGDGFAVSAAAFSLCGGGAVSVRGRAGGDVELVHPVCAGVHAPAGEARRAAADGHAGRVCRGALFRAAADEAHCRGAPDAASTRWPMRLLLAFAVARPGWAGMWAVFLTSFFMSLMFPTIFALGPGRAGLAGKAGRIAAGDGDCGRGFAALHHGLGFGARRYRAVLHGATGKLCGDCRV